MTTWFSGHGWGWCNMMVNAPAMVLIWGALITILVLALRTAFTRPGDPAAPTGAVAARHEGVAVAPSTRSEFDDNYHRRLM
ncbi:hypothetical protein [Mycobacterium sp. UM_CSW]|uniref:hypothetical protein n=1 Tax=Mycobacterium sp. UM_CSW TaxID=1370119 RepID=UPI0003F7A2F9|nr:hypothetical protein [Mycobacterium sp. UM_CSW]